MRRRLPRATHSHLPFISSFIWNQLSNCKVLSSQWRMAVAVCRRRSEHSKACRCTQFSHIFATCIPHLLFAWTIRRSLLAQHLRVRCVPGRLYSLASSALTCSGLEQATSIQRLSLDQNLHSDLNDEGLQNRGPWAGASATDPTIFCISVRTQPSRTKLPSASTLLALVWQPLM